MAKKTVPYIVLLVWGIVVWAFFQFFYEYSFYYKEQNQLFLLSWEYIRSYFSRSAWAAELAGDFITQWFYYMYVGAAVFTILSLFTGELVRHALLRLHFSWSVSLVVALLVMGLMVVFNFSPDYRMAGVIGIMGTASLFLLWTAFTYTRPWIKVVAAVICSLLSYWLFGFGIGGGCKLSTPHFELEDYLAADNLYYFGRYEELFKRVEEMDKHDVTPVISCYYYMAKAQQGVLAQAMGKVTPVCLGTLFHIGPQSTMQEIKVMNELYFLLGDMTMTERAAMLGCVSSPRNRNVRMVKRLAETNLVTDDKEAAMKYLRLLEKTLVYRRWAVTNHPDRISSSLQSKRMFINKTDRLRLSDNCRDVLVGLLESNPHNLTALHYLMCTDILVGQRQVFLDDFRKYYMPVHGEPHEPLYKRMLDEDEKKY